MPFIVLAIDLGCCKENRRARLEHTGYTCELRSLSQQASRMREPVGSVAATASASAISAAIGRVPLGNQIVFAHSQRVRLYTGRLNPVRTAPKLKISERCSDQKRHHAYRQWTEGMNLSQSRQDGSSSLLRRHTRPQAARKGYFFSAESAKELMKWKGKAGRFKFRPGLVKEVPLCSGHP
jgi:hypothetical protein